MEHAQRVGIQSSKEAGYGVLILILMEHAQRDEVKALVWEQAKQVLILILMEHAQRAYEDNVLPSRVLILILMEHAQRVLYTSM